MSMKMFVWSNHFSFLAVAQAESVAKAREAMLVEMGESGDGSCPERDKARQQILSENPSIWQGTNAEFALSDSAEVREITALNEKLLAGYCEQKAEIERQKATITGLSARFADERSAREAAERANEELRDELAKVRSLSLDAVERHSKLRLEAEVALVFARKERDEALRVRDLAREASNRDLEAKRKAQMAIRGALQILGEHPDAAGVLAAVLGLNAALLNSNEQQTAAAGGTREAEKGRAQIIGDSV